MDLIHHSTSTPVGFNNPSPDTAQRRESAVLSPEDFFDGYPWQHVVSALHTYRGGEWTYTFYSPRRYAPENETRTVCRGFNLRYTEGMTESESRVVAKWLAQQSWFEHVETCRLFSDPKDADSAQSFPIFPETILSEGDDDEKYHVFSEAHGWFGRFPLNAVSSCSKTDESLRRLPGPPNGAHMKRLRAVSQAE